MRIVVLDGYTLNPGDLSWDELKELGEVDLYDYTSSSQVLERSKGAEIILTNKTPLTTADFEELPDLKYIGVLATGFNVVDIEGAKNKNIVVTNIPTYGTRSVAQMTFALLLEMTQHVQAHSDAVFRGEWSNCRDFCFWNHPLIELEGKTMGLIGFGRIGQSVADVAEAFGMKVMAYDAIETDQSHRKNFQWADLDQLLAQSDVISLHCPLTPGTKGIIHKESLNKMKKSAYLINTSRGPLVVEEDLAAALNQNEIAGAGLDVLAVEPPVSNHPLFAAKNCIITPHISWATKEARSRLMETAVNNLRKFIEKNPVNVVNR